MKWGVIFYFIFNEWQVTLIGQAHYPGSSTLCIFVGDGDNDGLNEVYTGTWTPYPYNGYNYQFKWDGTNWIRDTIWKKCPHNIMDITVGDANNDGLNEVYSSLFQFLTGTTKNLYQFIYQDTIWVLADSLGKEGGFQTFIYDGDNDGVKELYGVGHAEVGYTRVHQYKWNGYSWEIAILGNNGNNFHSLYVGDADNDGMNEVVATNTDGKIYYYKWINGAWIENTIPYGVPYSIVFKSGLVIGDGDNDGLNEIYVAFYNYNSQTQRRDRYIYKYWWNGSNWVSEQVIYLNEYNMTNGGLVIGDGDNDGLNELYDLNTVGTPGVLGIYKIFYFQNSWNYEFIPTGITNPAGPGTDLCMGDGDNDGKLELYLAAGGVNGEIYQFKYITTDVSDLGKITNKNNEIICKPSKGFVRFFIKSFNGNNIIEIFNLAGRRIKKFSFNTNSSHDIIIIWDGKDEMGDIVPNGLYIVKFGYKKHKFLFLK